MKVDMPLKNETKRNQSYYDVVVQLLNPLPLLEILIKKHKISF